MIGPRKRLRQPLTLINLRLTQTRSGLLISTSPLRLQWAARHRTAMLNPGNRKQGHRPTYRTDIKHVLNTLPTRSVPAPDRHSQLPVQPAQYQSPQEYRYCTVAHDTALTTPMATGTIIIISTTFIVDKDQLH